MGNSAPIPGQLPGKNNNEEEAAAGGGGGGGRDWIEEQLPGIEEYATTFMQTVKRRFKEMEECYKENKKEIKKKDLLFK